MQRLFMICFFIASLFVSLSTALASDKHIDDPVTLLHNADIFTLNAEQPWADAMAYDANGIIVAIGSLSDVMEVAGTVSEKIDANSSMVLPGFIDTHVHVPEAGINESLCLLPANESIATYEKLIHQCAQEQSDETWVRAAGASLFNLRDSDELPVHVLDRAVPNRPALILDDLGHAVWTNSMGLAAAGISKTTPAPRGGVILRDSVTDKLTGLLLEDAQQHVRNVAATDAKTSYEGLLLALSVLAENGVTAISDAGGYWAQGHMIAWLRAEKEETLTVRAVNSLYVYPNMNRDKQLADFKQNLKIDADALLQFTSAKIYVDGILDLGTALLLQPYDNPVDEDYPSGFSYFETNLLNDYVEQLSKIGYRMHFHVIGDKAVRLALDSIEALPLDADGRRQRGHRTTHTYLVDSVDMPRFKELSVIADFQVGEDSINPDYHDDLYGIIGERAYGLLPVSSLLEAGATVSLSSDWDADPLSPLGIIQRSLTRESHAVVDLSTAISLVTRNAAIALGLGEVTGMLATGMQADYVVLDQNLFEIPKDDIADTVVVMTVLAGRRVYDATR